MAEETATELFLGEDRLFEFHILDADVSTTAINITGWALSFMIKKRRSDADASALVTKTTVSGIAIAGTFNATASSNTQRATVTLADTDSSSLNPGLAYYELKRTDDGFETVLAYGPITLKQGVHR